VTASDFLLGAYALLLVGAALRQFPQLAGRRPLRWDAVGVFPGFSFFAPIPGGHDYFLLWRGVRGGLPGDWREPRLLRRRTWRSAVWNPEKRVRKAVIDLAGALAHEVAVQTQRDIVMLSVPYLLILQHVSSLGRAAGADAVQFAILTAAGSDRERKIDLLVSSAVHRVDG
jgi:hypothetical protein